MMAVVTNIDADHMETYGGDFERLRQTFIEFLHQLPFYGLAVLCIDDPVVNRMLPEVTKPVLTYGFDEAADAFKRALTQLGESAELLSGYAEALISANRGIVSPEARRAYATVLKLNKGAIIARFRLAMAQEQDGNLKQASDEYRELLLLGDPESSWRRIVSDRLAFVNRQLLKSPGGLGAQTASNSTTAPGPSAADVKAAQQMSARDRSQMINNMVDHALKTARKFCQHSSH